MSLVALLLLGQVQFYQSGGAVRVGGPAHAVICGNNVSCTPSGIGRVTITAAGSDGGSSGGGGYDGGKVGEAYAADASITAQALAADPADCPSGTFVTGIDAYGVPTCSAPSIPRDTLQCAYPTSSGSWEASPLLFTRTSSTSSSPALDSTTVAGKRRRVNIRSTANNTANNTGITTQLPWQVAGNTPNSGAGQVPGGMKVWWRPVSATPQMGGLFGQGMVAGFWSETTLFAAGTPPSVRSNGVGFQCEDGGTFLKFCSNDTSPAANCTTLTGFPCFDAGSWYEGDVWFSPDGGTDAGPVWYYSLTDWSTGYSTTGFSVSQLPTNAAEKYPHFSYFNHRSNPDGGNAQIVVEVGPFCVWGFR